MIAKYNLVVVKEAQQLPSSAFDELASYAAHSTPQSIVVLCHMHSAFDKRKKLYKPLKRQERC